MLDQRDDNSPYPRLAWFGGIREAVCRPRRRQTVLLCLAMLSFASVNLMGCLGAGKETLKMPGIENIPDITGDSLRMLYTKDGRCEMEMRTPAMNVYAREEKEYDEFPRGIDVRIYDSLGHLSTMLRANYALYLRKKKLWDARHNVVGINKQGDSIQTERMFWDEEKKLIYSEESVRIRTADALLFGRGFESDERFNNWEIRYPKGVITVREQADTLRNAEK